MKKQTIAVLFGGHSPEYGVSLQSAYSVLRAIDCEKYEPLPVGITRGGEWYLFSGDIEKIKDDSWHNGADCTKAAISPDRVTRGLLVFESATGASSVRVLRLDGCFPVLHGQNGEDGTVQGLCELAGIPLIGSGALASALCMDKDKAKKIAASVGVAVPHSFVFKQKSDIPVHGRGVCLNSQNDSADMAQYIAQVTKLGYPLFVKPVRAGSSYGISKIMDASGLPAALALAARYDEEIIIEEGVAGFEIGCAVLGNDELIVGELDEIELAGGFFDHDEKYSLATSAIHVPARISTEKAAKAKEMAKAIYRALGLKGFARVDMFFTPSGEIVFNEVNTIPGLTAHSRYPEMLKAIGLSFAEVVGRVITLGLGIGEHT